MLQMTKLRFGDEVTCHSKLPAPACQAPEPVLLRAPLPAAVAPHGHPAPGDWPLGPQYPEGKSLSALSPILSSGWLVQQPHVTQPLF